MAEGFARALKGEVIEAFSAGVEPHGMNARAMQVMREAGVPIEGQRSKHVEELKEAGLEVVVTVCGHAQESCPMWLASGAKVVHVGFEDPPLLAKGAKTEEEAWGHYRRVRDEIRAWVETLPGSLTEKGAGR